MMWSMCRVAVIVWDRPLLQGLLDDVVYVSAPVRLIYDKACWMMWSMCQVA